MVNSPTLYSEIVQISALKMVAYPLYPYHLGVDIGVSKFNQHFIDHDTKFHS